MANMRYRTKMMNKKPILNIDEIEILFSEKMKIHKVSNKNFIRRLDKQDLLLLYGTAEIEPELFKNFCPNGRSHCVWANAENNFCTMPACFYDIIKSKKP